MWRSLLYLSFACVGVFLQHMLQSLDTRHGWTQCSGGQPMQAGACVSVCVYVCHVDHVRSLRARLHSAEWFISSCSCGLDGYGGGGEWDSWSGPERVCVCACSPMHVCCVCVNEWVVATAYPFRIPMKLNQHFSFVFGMALWAVWGPMKDIQQ